MDLAIESTAVIAYQTYARYCYIINFPASLGFCHAIVDRYRLLALSSYYLSPYRGITIVNFAF